MEKSDKYKKQSVASCDLQPKPHLKLDIIKMITARFPIYRSLRGEEMIIVSDKSYKDETFIMLLIVHNGIPSLDMMMSKYFINMEKLNDTYAFDEFWDAYKRARTDLVRTQLYRADGMYRDLVCRADMTIAQIVRSQAMDTDNEVLFVKQVIASGVNIPAIKIILDIVIEEEADKRFYNKKASIIQKCFRDVVSNPYHSICRRRLIYEFVNAVNSL